MFIAISFWGRNAKIIVSDLKPDIVHHVTLSTIRALTPFYLDNTRVVWGPLGGGHKAPLAKLGFKGSLYETFRNLTIFFSESSYRILGKARAFKGVVLATNNETFEFAKKSGFRHVKIALSDGLRAENVINSAINLPSIANKEISLLWAGRLVASKRPDIAIAVLRELLSRGYRANLTLGGVGPMEKAIIENSRDLLESKTLRLNGFIPWSEMPKAIDESNFVLFTSMRDSSAPLVLEAAGRGVPTVAIRSQGIQAIFPQTFVTGPDLSMSQNLIILMMADTIARIAEDKDLYFAQREQAVLFAQTQTWEIKCQQVLAETWKSNG